MKQYFYYAIALLVPLAILGWFLYALGRTFVTLFQDWKLGREVKELQAQSEARRQQQRQEQELRLANGCAHDFDAGVFGLPPGVCSKCGLHREKPIGACDHVWRIVQGPVPKSRCETCGKTYSAASQRDAFG